MKIMALFKYFFALSIIFFSNNWSIAENIVSNDNSKKSSKLFYINGIKALIFGADETHLVTTLDIHRPAIFEGRFLEEKEYLTRLLFFEDSRSYKVPVDDDTVDKYLMGIQKEYGLSPDAVKQMFKESGYTYQEGRNALKMLYTNNALLGFKINDRLVVSEQAVSDYYKEHQEIIEPEYLLEIATVNIDEKDNKELMRKRLEESVKEYNEASVSTSVFQDKSVHFDVPFWIKESEIAQEKKEITLLKSGQIWIFKTESGFDLFRLKEKKGKQIRPLDNTKYQEIVDIVRQPIYTKLREEYEEEVWKKFPVLYPVHVSSLSKFDVVGLPD